METIPVYYLVGADPKSGKATDLAKFFSQQDADAHRDRYSPWHKVHVDMRHEPLAAQHEAHRGMTMATGASVSTSVASGASPRSTVAPRAK